MADVQDALRGYEQAVTAAGFDLFTALRPGRPREEIIDRLRAAGIEPIEDVVDWFSFSDGLRPIAPGGPELQGIFDGTSLVSLDDALAERERRLDPGFLAEQFGEEQLRELSDANLIVAFETTWLPISRGKETCVIETSPDAERVGRLIALWADELEPRVKAADLATWITSLAAAVPNGGIHLAVAADAAPAGSIVVELGSLELTRPRAQRLGRLRDNPFLQDCVGIRLMHAPRGSVAANGSLEEQQVDLVEDHLRQAGFAHLRFERVAVEPDTDRHHAIRILGILDR